jgi:hypothetical protein
VSKDQIEQFILRLGSASRHWPGYLFGLRDDRYGGQAAARILTCRSSRRERMLPLRGLLLLRRAQPSTVRD